MFITLHGLEEPHTPMTVNLNQVQLVIPARPTIDEYTNGCLVVLTDRSHWVTESRLEIDALIRESQNVRH
jgi:hypothetical protein